MSAIDVQQIKAEVDKCAETMERIRLEVRKVLVGQDELLSRLLTALLTGGHILLEGVPGLAKTTAIKALAAAVQTRFQRIQFTPDLLPADLIGTLIYNPREGSFTTKKGPIFANLILADEINRAPSKVQSALLEAMQERQVTIGDETFKLPAPFLVLATQNPIEQEGTYHLPEAQLDRFMYELRIGYPTVAEEEEIVSSTTGVQDHTVKPVLPADTLREMMRLVRRLPAPPELVSYAVSLARATRPDEPGASAMVKKYISFGAGPRAGQYLVLGAKARAAMDGRTVPDLEDVDAVAFSVLRHRVVLNFQAEAEGMGIEKILALGGRAKGK